jgi:hypothetical protein
MLYLPHVGEPLAEGRFQIEDSPLYSISQGAHLVWVSLRRMRTALPFFGVLVAFFIIAFADMVLLGNSTHGIPLVAALLASLSVERVLHCWE